MPVRTRPAGRSRAVRAGVCRYTRRPTRASRIRRPRTPPTARDRGDRCPCDSCAGASSNTICTARSPPFRGKPAWSRHDPILNVWSLWETRCGSECLFERTYSPVASLFRLIFQHPGWRSEFWKIVNDHGLDRQDIGRELNGCSSFHVISGGTSDDAGGVRGNPSENEGVSRPTYSYDSVRCSEQLRPDSALSCVRIPVHTSLGTRMKVRR
jgi:hypothetical protein